MGRDSTIAAAIVTITVMLILGMVTAIILTRTAPMADWQVAFINQLAGAVIGAFVMSVSFWVGSSIGSKTKDDTISQITKS